MTRAPALSGRHSALLSVVLALALSIALAACGGSKSDQGSSGGSGSAGGGATASSGKGCGSKDAFTLAFQPQIGLAPAVLADQQGFMGKACIQQKVEVVAQPTIGLANIASGRDQMFTGPISVLYQAMQQGLRLKVIGPAAYNGPGVAVVAGKDVKSYKDLQGKTIAVAGVNSTVQAAMAVRMQQAGVDLKSVKFTQLPFPAIPAALGANRAQAAFLVEPFVTIGKGKLHVLESGPLKVFGTDAIAAYAYVSEKYWQSHKDVVARYQKAYLQGAAYAAQHPDAVRAFAVSVLKTPQPIAQQMGLLGFGTDFKVDSAMKEIETMQRLGYLKPGISVAQLKAQFLIPQS
jgi:NitT/TauT family transport system substrate-binding protein